MELPPVLALVDWALVGRLGSSLIAISLLYFAACRLNLGGDPRLADAAEARLLAHDGLYGFEAEDVVLDRAGMSALLRDKAGRHAVLTRVGNRFIVRLVPDTTGVRLDQSLLSVDLEEPGLPPVIMNLGEKAQYWASGLRHLPNG